MEPTFSIFLRIKSTKRKSNSLARLLSSSFSCDEKLCWLYANNPTTLVLKNKYDTSEHKQSRRRCSSESVGQAIDIQHDICSIDIWKLLIKWAGLHMKNVTSYYKD